MSISTSTNPTPRRTGAEVAAYPVEYTTNRRIRWSAIFAGALLAVAISFSLNLLGVGIGLSTIDPATETRPFAGVGTGAIIWYVIATLLSLLAGGYVAGRLAGFPRQLTAGLHGVLAWALFTLFSLYLLNSAIGKVFSAVGSTFSTVASATGNVVGAAIPDDLGQRIQAQIRESDINLQDVRREARELLKDTGKSALDPDNLEQTANDVANTAKEGAKDVAANPNASGQQFDDVIGRIATSGESVVNAADKDALVNIIVARTDQTEAEARQTVNAWSQKYEEGKALADQKLKELGETAKEVGDDVADTLATISILGFLALLAGAGAAFFGGMLGRSHDVTLLPGEHTINAASVD